MVQIYLTEKPSSEKSRHTHPTRVSEASDSLAIFREENLPKGTLKLEADLIQ